MGVRHIQVTAGCDLIGNAHILWAQDKFIHAYHELSLWNLAAAQQAAAQQAGARPQQEEGCDSDDGKDYYNQQHHQEVLAAAFGNGLNVFRHDHPPIFLCSSCYYSASIKY
ncbi:MAG TPA: hypothetical protein DCY42_09565 [Chloroflexi bacterium]|nr:hypothetical protein [Chloroflexota bacterium]